MKFSVGEMIKIEEGVGDGKIFSFSMTVMALIYVFFQYIR